MIVDRKGREAATEAFAHPRYARLANALVGLQYLDRGDVSEALPGLLAALAGEGPLGAHSFMLKYMPHFDYELTIYRGIAAGFPLCETLLGLAAAECLQAMGRIPEAIDLVEEADPSVPAALSLADLYAEAGRWDEIVSLTDGLVAEDELTAGLMLLRGEAQMNLGHHTAARECIRPLTTQKKLGTALRHMALVLRAQSFAEEGAFAKARMDLEKVMAEESRYPGLKESIAATRDGEEAAAAAKEAEKQRVAAEKLAERERAREERRVEAERAREERARARLEARPTPAPAAQAGFIDLTDEGGAAGTGPDRNTAAEASTAPAGDSAPREAGFYPDPEGVAPYRYWDGSAWTTRVRMSR